MHMIAYSGRYNICIHTIRSQYDLSNTSLLPELLLCIILYCNNRGREGGEGTLGVPYCSINRALEGERGGGGRGGSLLYSNNRALKGEGRRGQGGRGP